VYLQDLNDYTASAQRGDRPEISGSVIAPPSGISAFGRRDDVVVILLAQVDLPPEDGVVGHVFGQVIAVVTERDTPPPPRALTERCSQCQGALSLPTPA
jgi:hypothetical protein